MPFKTRPNGRGKVRRWLIVCALAVCMCLLLTSCVTTSDGTKLNIFTILIVWPFAYVLRFIYDLIGSYGWAIILFQVVAKILLLPLSVKSKKGMLAMQRVQPQMQALEAKYKNDPNKKNEEMAKLYQKEGVSPTSGCLPTLISFPILIGLYWPISQPLTYLMRLSAAEITKLKEALSLTGARISEITVAQSAVENFSKVSSITDKLIPMDFNFLGMNLGAVPSFRVFNALFFLPILSAAASFGVSYLSNYLQEKQTGRKMEGQGKSMLYMMPLMSLWIGYSLPAGLCLYWIAGSITGALEQLFLHWYMTRKMKDGPIMTKKQIEAAKLAQETANKITTKHPKKKKKK